MTISYLAEVTTTGSSFVQLFFKWRGSVWKAVYKELFIWLVVFFSLNFTYRWLMEDEYKRTFEKLCVFFHKYLKFIPLTFLLGFFVTLVVNRWWKMWERIGWIDTPALYINTHLPGDDEKARMYRRGMVRYVLFFQVLVLRDISISIRDRFPTLDTFVPAGYLTEEELYEYLNTPTNYKNYYTPIRWAMNLVRQARSEGKITADLGMRDILERIMQFRIDMDKLLMFDYQPIPLIYTVVVCLIVRLYFIFSLMGSQTLVDAPLKDHIDVIDFYFPVMTVVQFVFYMGWMKVAEALLNPFGDDDEDFELNWLIDRNFEVGLVIADQVSDVTLVKDKHWNNRCPEPLYSLSTVDSKLNPLMGSAAKIRWMQENKGSKSRAEVVMVPRTPTNLNEDATVAYESDGTVHVRFHREPSEKLLRGVQRKLTELAHVASHQDLLKAEGKTKENDNYTFKRKSVKSFQGLKRFTGGEGRNGSKSGTPLLRQSNGVENPPINITMIDDENDVGKVREQ